MLNGPAAPGYTVDTGPILAYNVCMMKTLITLAVLLTQTACANLDLVNNRDGSVHAYTVGQHQGSELFVGDVAPLRRSNHR